MERVPGIHGSEEVCCSINLQQSMTQVQEGHVWEDMKTSASNFATKVKQHTSRSLLDRRVC